MTARIALLMVAVVGLAACESTKSVDTSPSKPVAVQTTSASYTSSPMVVRSPLVPDPLDGVRVASNSSSPRVHRPRRPASDIADTSTTTSVADAYEPTAPVSKPAKPSKPSKPSKPDTAATEAPVTTADATPPPATPTDTAPAPTDTAPDTATPTTTDTAAADGTTPKSMFSDPSAFMQAQIGGFPVWLVGLVGLVLLAALLIGMGGSRKKSEEVI